MRLFFLTIPKPLKQHPIYKKDHPFRSSRQRLILKDLEEKPFNPRPLGPSSPTKLEKNQNI